MTGSRPDLDRAIEEASRSLGLTPETSSPAGKEPPRGRDPDPEPARGARRAIWIVLGLLALASALALALRSAGTMGQPAHLVESDLRWAVARVVEHVEQERLLRGRAPEASELRVLLGETLTYTSLEGGGYRVVGERDGVRVEYDGSVPLGEWSAIMLHPPGTETR